MSTVASAKLVVANEEAAVPCCLLADLWQMARPRILVMSAAAIAGGYVLASPGPLSWPTLVIAIPAICCFVAASSVLNQVMEHRSDRKMVRTSNRPVASGRVSLNVAFLFGVCLSAVGAVVLWWQVNALTSIASFLTMLSYVLVYTPLKRRTAFCTTIGAVPGAMPPVLGWFAAGGDLTVEALALFAIFFVWQFPHFLAIGWIYRDQYQSAGLKMLPSYTDSGRRTGWIALCYALAFVPVTCVPRFVGLAGPGYLSAAVILSLGYLWLTIRFFVERSDVRARQLMVGSLICLPVLLCCLVLDFIRLTA